MGRAKKRKMAKLARINEEKTRARKTKYSEIVFDSFLEAQWAAFFDLCSISWEYKPSLLDEDYIDWQPRFRLELIYKELPAIQDCLTLGFYTLVTPSPINPFPKESASQLMRAHPYNHDLISIKDLVEQDVGCPEKEITGCPLDRVAILGESPLEICPEKMVKSKFKSLQEIAFAEKQLTPDKHMVISGWCSPFFKNDSRLWAPLEFLSGNREQIKNEWVIAKHLAAEKMSLIK